MLNVSVIASVLILFIYATLIWLFLSIILWTIRNKISPMPSSKKARKGIFELLPVKMEGVVYDLGSGWGSLAFPLAKKYSDCYVIGYESSTIPYFFSKLRLLLFPTENLEFRRKDFFKASLENASTIICYLYPGAMKKLGAKFKSELKGGTVVVSNTFSIPEWKPDRSIIIDDLYHSEIFFYIFSTSSHTIEKNSGDL